jgi:RND family efflux transporter MFP subunit
MKPTRSPACSRPDGAARQTAANACRLSFAIAALVVLTGCEKNSFVSPPPPKVDVGLPVQQTVTRFLEATGNTAPIKSVDLVARVQGVLQSIDYKDGTLVKEGATLFTIEPETYKLKLEQAQAAEAGAQASAKQAEADFKRQSDLVSRQAVSQATLDQSTSSRDNAQANLQQAQANTKIAAVNFGYTNVVAPFDGIVSAHLISVGELVGAASPTQLATIVQLDPIYVNFNVNEQDVLRVRAEAKRRGLTASDLTQLPIEVGLQTEDGYPHKGKLTMRRRRSTSRRERWRCAACCRMPSVSCCPDIMFASAFPSTSRRTPYSSPMSHWAAINPDAMYWWSTAKTSSSSARSRPGRSRAICA